ncbi:MAG: hypothetical protein BAJALOKI1v1_130001, partial [Promethearchaeota archaeon]
MESVIGDTATLGILLIPFLGQLTDALPNTALPYSDKFLDALRSALS